MRWSKRENRLLKKFYAQYLLGNISKDELMKIFNRDMTAIYNHASLKGYNKVDGDRVNEDFVKKLEKILDI